MLERGKLMMMFIGQREGAMDGLFQRGRKGRHVKLLSVGWRFGAATM